MLGLLSSRSPKPWILSSLSSRFSLHQHSSPVLQLEDRRRRFNSGGGVVAPAGTGAVSVWHAVVPTAGSGGDWRRDFLLPKAAVEASQRCQRGEGSWNVAWDARPARWIHRVDLACLLFGVSSFLAPVDWNNFLNSLAPATVDVEEEVGDGGESHGGGVSDDKNCDDSSVNYRVIGILADGRCLFRAIAHGARLRNGEEAPDENHQRELADELRAQVVDELLRRREDSEWFIEGDFDAYVKRIQQPYVWGGEPELIMASHVLKAPIDVYMKEKSSENLTNIASYGIEYQKDKELPINLLFHGYGHYELLEMSSNQICRNSSM